MPGKGPGPPLPACVGASRGLEGSATQPVSGNCDPLFVSGIDSSTRASSGLRTFQEAARGGARSASTTTQFRPVARRWLLPFSVLLIVAALLLVYYWARPLPVPKVSNYVQLTHDGQPKALIGTDGSRLYLGYSKPTTPIPSVASCRCPLRGRAGPYARGFHCDAPFECLAGWSRTSRQRQAGCRI